MNKKFFISIFLIFVFFSVHATTDIAITVDDLPIHGEASPGISRTQIATQMLDALDKHGVAGVYGMVNGKNVDKSFNGLAILKLWALRGQRLGNHTYSHSDLVATDLPTYLHDIEMNDRLLVDVMGTQNFHYFRYPYLAEGESEEKRNGVRNYLKAQHYTIAEVTTDWFDYEWNTAYVRCLRKKDNAAIEWLKVSYLKNAVDSVEVAQLLAQLEFKRPVKQILLLHVGQFEAMMMDDLLSALETKQVRFISLDEAVADPIYQIDPNVLAPRPYTFLNQIRVARHLKNPPRVKQIYDNLPEDQLA